MSQNIQQVTPFERPDQITIGNEFSLTLSNLLFVPSITKNLISASQFCKDNDVFFEFHSSFCLVKSQVSKLVLLKGFVGRDGLYHFPQLLAFMLKCNLSSNVCKSVKGFVQIPVVSTVTRDSDFQCFIK